jgi:hypothetical protein
MTTDFDPEYAEAGIRTVKGHTLNKTRQRFSFAILTGCISVESHCVNLLEAI